MRDVDTSTTTNYYYLWKLPWDAPRTFVEISLDHSGFAAWSLTDRICTFNISHIWGGLTSVYTDTYTYCLPPIYPATYIQYKYKICNTDPPHQLGYCHISVTTYEKSHPVSGEYGMGYKKQKHTEIQACTACRCATPEIIRYQAGLARW